MFERYTEKARRVIFFARYEASQFGSSHIETEHLLLGLLREDKSLTNRFLRSHAEIEAIRKQIEKRTPRVEKGSTSVDLPLSEESKRALHCAAEEADQLGHKHIGTEHILLGLLRGDKSLAATILHEGGLRLPVLREELSRAPSEKTASKESSLLSEFSRDLTQAAADKQLGPLIGRETEVERLVQILCRFSKNNPLMVGEPGIGKTAIAEGVARRIAEGNVPTLLADKRILALDPWSMVGGISPSGQFEGREHQIRDYVASMLAGPRTSRQLEEGRRGVAEEIAQSQNLIIYINNLHTLVDLKSLARSFDAATLLRQFITRGQGQCIGAVTPKGYEESIQSARWIEKYFSVVKVDPPSVDDAIKILFGVKDRYENFHSVTYTDDALKYAVYHSNRYIVNRFLPDKALDVIDEAGARARLRHGALPEEVMEAQKRHKFVARRMESAIANHEIAKARAYAEEEQKERENLKLLREKFKIDETVTKTVTRQDIDEVVAHWTGVPIAHLKQDGAPSDSGTGGTQA